MGIGPHMKEDARTHTGMGPPMWPVGLFVSPCVGMRLHEGRYWRTYRNRAAHPSWFVYLSSYKYEVTHEMRSHMRKGLRKHILIGPHTHNY